MHQHIPHVIAAAQHVQQAVKYYPFTAKDKTAAEHAGVFAAVVAGILLVFKGRRRSPVTSK